MEWNGYGGSMSSATINLEDIGYWTNADSFRALAIHELGHVLGLADIDPNKQSCSLPDVMCYRVPDVEAPSTLDLYAVHFQIHGTPAVTQVTLPSSIPYETARLTMITTTTTTPSTDFSLSVSPSAVLLNPHGKSSPSFNLVVIVNGSGGTIQLAAAGLPPDFKLVNMPPSSGGSPGTTETYAVILEMNNQTANGNYTLTITGNSGNITHSVELKIRVTSPALTSASVVTSSQSTLIVSSVRTNSDILHIGLETLAIAVVLLGVAVVILRTRNSRKKRGSK